MTETPTKDQLRRILTTHKRFACVGLSANPIRPSYYVARYLKLKGFDVTAVNPAIAGTELFGRPVAESLSAIEHDIDVVDIFRRSEAVPGIVDEALERFPNLKVVWMQIGVSHAAAAAKAEARGVEVIQNRCPKIEYQKLTGELGMAGFDTGIISSKL